MIRSMGVLGTKMSSEGGVTSGIAECPREQLSAIEERSGLENN